MLRPVLVTPPAATPIDLDDAKRQVRRDDTADDTILGDLIATAAAYLDGPDGVLRGRALITQTWRQDFPCFGELRLPLAPVQSITSVTYRDATGASQTVDSADYRLLSDALGPYVALVPATLAAAPDWPQDVQDRADAVSVTFVAGYGNAATDVPQPLRHAVRLLVGAWYENRENTVVGVSAATLPKSVNIDALIAPYRRVRL